MSRFSIAKKFVSPVAAALAVSLAPALAAADEPHWSGDPAATVAPAAQNNLPRGIYKVRRYTPAPSTEATVTSPTVTGCKLTNHGGPVISNVQIVIVYWNTGVDSGLQSYAPGFFQTIVKSPYMDWLQEYNTSSQQICRGSYLKAVQITPKSATGKSIDDSQIGPELAAQIKAGVLPAPTTDAKGNVNTLYFIFFPPGYSISLQGSSSCQAFCGYHSDGSYNGTYLPYAVIPDLSPNSKCFGGCGDFPAAQYVNNYGLVSSHELIEAITDVDVGDNQVGWYDDGGQANQDCNGEIGDICAATAAGQNEGTTVSGMSVQVEWSNKSNKCIGQATGFTPCGGTSCTSNADCSAPTGVCDTGSGNCVACLANSDCSGATPVCDKSTNTCKACSSDTDCSGGLHCATGSSDPNKGKCVQCTTSSQCSSTKPVCTNDACGGCKTNSDCGNGKVCTASGGCGQCNSNSDCTDPNNPQCDSSTNTCVPAGTPTPMPTGTGTTPNPSPTGTGTGTGTGNHGGTGGKDAGTGGNGSTDPGGDNSDLGGVGSSGCAVGETTGSSSVALAFVVGLAALAGAKRRRR